MPDQAKHISSGFDAGLHNLRNDVLMMSSLTDRMFQTAFEALLDRNSELCDHVVAKDEEVDVLEKQVDQDGSVCCFDITQLHPICGRLFLR